jgi:hypothetical protein
MNSSEARRILSNGIRDSLKLTPREQAGAAHWAGGPSVDELEAKVIDLRRRLGFPQTAAIPQRQAG